MDNQWSRNRFCDQTKLRINKTMERNSLSFEQWCANFEADKAVARDMLHVFGRSFLGKNLLIMNNAVGEGGGNLRSPRSKMTF